MMGVAPLRTFLREASINTSLHLALSSFKLSPKSGVGMASYSGFLKLRFEFHPVHLDRFFAEMRLMQGAEHLLIRYKQFLRSRGKVHTLNVLSEIFLSMEVALTTLILFPRINSFCR